MGRTQIDRVKENIKIIIRSGETESDPFDISAITYGRLQVIGYVTSSGKRKFAGAASSGTITMTGTVQDIVDTDSGFSYVYLTPTDETGADSAITLDLSAAQTFQFSPEQLTFKTAKITIDVAPSQDLQIEIAGYA